MNFNDKFLVKKEIQLNHSNIILFCVIANGMEHLPSFMSHYRAIGISQFYFLIDKSDDGTEEFLNNQNDVGIIVSDLRYGDIVEYEAPNKQKIKNSAGNFFKFIVPYCLFQNNWVLTVDSDEYLELPEKNKSILSLITDLNIEGSFACRGLMVDVFPNFISKLVESCKKKGSEPDFYIDLPEYLWPAKQNHCLFYNQIKEVKTRILMNYLEKRNENNDEYFSTFEPKNFSFPTRTKIPLNYWHKHAHANAHFSSNIATDKIQVALRHECFSKKFIQKVENAVKEGQYHGSSSAYIPIYFLIKNDQNFQLYNQHSILISETDMLKKAPFSYNNV